MRHIVFLILMVHSVVASGIDSLGYYNAEIHRAYKENAQKLPDLYQQKLAYLKSKDNLEGFIYAHIDYFLLEPSVERQKYLQDYFSEKWRNASTPGEQIAELHLMVNTAYYQQRSGLISHANDAYEKAYTYWLKHKIADYDIVEYCLKPLANNYTRLGDPLRAEDLLRNALMISVSTNQTQQIAPVLNNLAIVYRTLGQVDKGINVLSKVLKITGNNSQQKALIESNVARLYINVPNFDQAIIHANASDRWQTAAQKTVSETTLKNCLTRMTAYQYLQEISEAENEIATIKKLLPQIYENGNREIAKTYNQLAEFYVSNGNVNNAFQCYQTSLNSLLPGYRLTANQNEDITQSAYPEIAIVETFDGMARLFIRQNEFEQALTCYDNAMLVAQMLRKNYSFQEAKINQQYDNHVRSEKAIEASWQLFQKSGDTKWLERAFQYADRSKSTVLEEELQLKDISRTIKNDPLLQEETNLQFERGVLNKNIMLEQAGVQRANVSNLNNLISKRNQNDLQLKEIQTKLAYKYPNLFYPERNQLTKKELQDSLLNANQLLLEFFEGEEAIYIFSLAKTGALNVQKITSPDSIKAQIIEFYEYLTNDHGQKILNNPEGYTETAYGIYQNLLGEVLEHSAANELIIIPDGTISFVPFNALLTKPETTANFMEMSFLVKTKQLAYSASAAILYRKMQQHNKRVKAANVLGFFPVFDKSTRNLGELKYSLNEAEGIEAQFKGIYLLRGDAKKEDFIGMAGQYDIVHLSTHASAGTRIIPPSIEFYNGTLFLPEIYGLNIHPQLLVLSACETGIGEVKKGEGLMSLARGFQYAGVNNIIVSQWKVNDKATAELMSLFYKNYQHNNNQHLALAQAQLDYLNNSEIPNNKKSPYYWAGFISIGELSSEKTILWQIILSVTVLCFSLLSGIVYFNRKRGFGRSKNKKNHV